MYAVSGTADSPKTHERNAVEHQVRELDRKVTKLARRDAGPPVHDRAWCGPGHSARLQGND